MNKTYAFSDIHGMYDLWAQIRDYCDETDTIYFLGDACDRGNKGVLIITELLKDKRVKYLKGNHEDMLVTCLSEMIEGHFENYAWWLQNGGESTWKVLEKLPLEVQLYFIRKLNELPKSAWYDSPKGHRVFLSHAGTDLNYTEQELIMKGRVDPYIWDRKHFWSKHPENMDNVFQVHGHTPVQNLYLDFGESPSKVKVFRYDDHKIDIDMGAFASGRVALIDLDDLDNIIYFDIKKVE